MKSHQVDHFEASEFYLLPESTWKTTMKKNQPTVMMGYPPVVEFSRQKKAIYVNYSSAHTQPPSSDRVLSSQLKSNGKVNHQNRSSQNVCISLKCQADHTIDIEEELTKNGMNIDDIMPNVDNLLPNRRIYRECQI